MASGRMHLRNARGIPTCHAMFWFDDPNPRATNAREYVDCQACMSFVNPLYASLVYDVREGGDDDELLISPLDDLA